MDEIHRRNLRRGETVEREVANQLKDLVSDAVDD
jgi:hypothetical protein